MKKFILGLIISPLLFVLVFYSVKACLPSYEYCDEDYQCSEGKECYYVKKTEKYTCLSGDPCQICSYPAMCDVSQLVLDCGPGAECTGAELSPIVNCATCADYTYFGCPSLCEQKTMYDCTCDAPPGVACTADCPEIEVCADPVSNGDLIKKDGLSTVYFVFSNQRYPFPDEPTYKSWYDDFPQVKTVSREKLESYPLSGDNITYQPGSLIKVTTDPKVYLVNNCGHLHWIVSEEIATEIFGSDWASLVRDLPDAFLTDYVRASEGAHSVDSIEYYESLFINPEIELIDEKNYCSPTPEC